MPEHPFVASSLMAFAVPVESLLEDPANARTHPDRNLEAIEASIRRFGQQTPVVHRRGVIIKGNATHRVMRRIGASHIAAIETQLSDAELAAYGIADNRAGELAEWNDEVLARLLGAMPADMQQAAGWTAAEISAVMDRLRSANAGRDDVPAAPAKAASRRGDLWLLGGDAGHRLLCGDSTAADDVTRLMGGARAALVSTDPPYLVDYTGVRPGSDGRSRGKDWSAVYREVEIQDAERFFTDVFSQVVRVAAPRVAVYCWHAHRRCGVIQAVWAKLGILDHQQIVWVKPTSVIGRVYWHFRHEPCMMGWIRGSKPAHDGEHGEDSVWEVDWHGAAAVLAPPAAEADSSVWRVDWEGKARIVNNAHPTQKPVELFARPMRRHTTEGQVCYEPFSGSGSQLIAGEELRRRVFAMELEPTFVDVALTRWSNLTGKQPTLDGDGRTFDEVRRERLGSDAQAEPQPG